MFLEMHYNTCHKMYNKYHHVSLWIGGRIQILQLINNASGNYSIPFHYDYVTLHKTELPILTDISNESRFYLLVVGFQILS